MLNQFKWHEISLEEQEKIKKQAKHILDSFANELKKIDDSKLDISINREHQTRKETASFVDKEFKKLWFKIIDNKEGDNIKAEKGKWL